MPVSRAKPIAQRREAGVRRAGGDGDLCVLAALVRGIGLRLPVHLALRQRDVRQRSRPRLQRAGRRALRRLQHRLRRLLTSAAADVRGPDGSEAFGTRREGVREPDPPRSAAADRVSPQDGLSPRAAVARAPPGSVSTRGAAGEECASLAAGQAHCPKESRRGAARAVQVATDAQAHHAARERVAPDARVVMTTNKGRNASRRILGNAPMRVLDRRPLSLLERVVSFTLRARGSLSPNLGAVALFVCAAATTASGVVGQRKQLNALDAARRPRPSGVRSALPPEATLVQRRPHSPQLEPQCALGTVADAHRTKLGGMLANPVATHAEALWLRQSCRRGRSNGTRHEEARRPDTRSRRHRRLSSAADQHHLRLIDAPAGRRQTIGLGCAPEASLVGGNVG
jgi:hypothetical protein